MASELHMYQPSEQQNQQAYGVFEAVTVVAKRKKLVIGVTLLVGIVATVGSTFIHNVYTGTSQIMPPQPQSGTSALLGQLSSLSGAMGQSLGVKNPNDTYVAMLNSRTVSDNLVKRFKLADVYDKTSPTDTRTALALATSIFSGKDGIITIQVDDEQPARAAQLANGYVEELQKLTQVLAVTEASQRRLFFEKQLLTAKQGLADAEVALKQVQVRTGLIQLTGQAEVIIRTVAELKAQIGAKEVGLGSMRTFATTSNPEYIRLQQELSELRAQLRKLETGSNSGNGDVSVSTSQVPQAGLEYIRKVRDVKYFETIFELLSKQYEIAKIDEAKQSSVIQVLDAAVVPDKKTKPARSILVIMLTLAAFVIMSAYALFSDWLKRIKSDTHRRERFDNLRQSFRWK